MINRRDFVAQAAGLALGHRRSPPAGPRGAAPGHGHHRLQERQLRLLRQVGGPPARERIRAAVHDEEDMDAVKDEMGVPKGVR